jgi:hypothetical protein
MIQQIIASLVKAISIKMNNSLAVINAQLLKLSLNIDETKSQLLTIINNSVDGLKQSDKVISARVEDLAKKVESNADNDVRIKRLEAVVANDDTSMDTFREIADRVKGDANDLKAFREFTVKNLNYIMPEQLRTLNAEQWNDLVTKMVDDNWSKN